MQPKSVAWMLLVVAAAGASARADDDGDAAQGIQHTQTQPAPVLPVEVHGASPSTKTPDAIRAMGTGTAARALTPSPSLRLDVVRAGPVQVATLGRFVLNAPEGPAVETGVGTELKAGVAVASAEAFVGKPLIAGAGDVLGEASAFAGVGGDTLRVGLEGRARGELVDDVKTVDDAGRAVETFVGPAASLRSGSAELKAEVGYEAPRGLALPGPGGFLLFHFDF